MTHNCTPDCTAIWTAGNKCHCRGCGRNFTTVANFDRHRVKGECVNPLSLRKPKMELNLRGFWRAVGETDRGELFRLSVVARLSGNGHSGEVEVER